MSDEQASSNPSRCLQQRQHHDGFDPEHNVFREGVLTSQFFWYVVLCCFLSFIDQYICMLMTNAAASSKHASERNVQVGTVLPDIGAGTYQKLSSCNYMLPDSESALLVQLAQGSRHTP